MGVFEAIRRAAGGRMGEDEHLQAIRDGVASLKAKGMLPSSHPPLRADVKYDTGHHVDSVLSGDDGTWTTYVVHDSDPAMHRGIAIYHDDIGSDHSRLGDSLSAAIRRPEVMQSMREQMQHRDAEEPRWFREFPA